MNATPKHENSSGTKLIVFVVVVLTLRCRGLHKLFTAAAVEIGRFFHSTFAMMAPDELSTG